MKYVFSLALCLASAFAMADQQPEVVSLSGASFIIKCTPGQDCNPPGYAVGPEIDIALTECTGVPNGYYSCAGTWTDTESMDGFSFTSTITAIKTTMTPVMGAKVDAQVSYQIIASTGPTLSSQSPTSITINLGQLGQMTDTVTFAGEPVVITNANPNVTYVPYLTVAPVPLGPTPMPAGR